MNMERSFSIAKESEQQIKCLQQKLNVVQQEMELTKSEKAWLQEKYVEVSRKLAEAEGKLREMDEKRRTLATAYAKSIVTYLLIMDDTLPEWRIFCQKELNQLKKMLVKKETDDQMTSGM